MNVKKIYKMKSSHVTAVVCLSDTYVSKKKNSELFQKKYINMNLVF